MTAPLVHRSAVEVTARQAAEMLGVSRDRISRAIYRGDLPARAVGRSYVIGVDDLEAYRRKHIAPAGVAA